MGKTNYPPKSKPVSKHVIVNASELNRIREESANFSRSIGDPSQSSEVERRERAQAKREKILAIEAQKRCNAPASDLDDEVASKQHLKTTKALQDLDEELDEVKRFNQMVALAKVQTILEVQREEKQRIRDMEREAERQAERKIELERLHALGREAELEKQKVEEQRRKSELILEQIKERETRKLIEEEEKIKERLWWQRKRDKEAEEEEKRLLEKQRAQKEHLDSILKANEMSQLRRSEQKTQEKEEDLQLLAYQRELAAKEREREDAEAREAARREHEISKLRASQERTKNKEAELDALRAKRALEAAERAAREKERATKQAELKMNENLAHARRVQQAERQLAQLEQAREDKKEFDMLTETQAKMRAAETLKQQAEARRRSEHAKELQAQINLHAERKMQARQDFLAEGNLVRARLAAEQKRLEHVRETKLDNLLKSGVPEKHCLNLRKALQT